MMGGIDQQVQQAMLSSGSDPRKLQKGYEQSVKQGSPDLAMLLGMQKLKSEKDAAAKEMQMQMDQQPQTIVEQREAELMGQSQQEMQQKLAPGMQQAGQKSKQEAMQQQLMGKNGGGPPPGAAQSGIAQAASPQQFAAGGIVSYAGNGPQGQLIGMPANVDSPYTTADTEAAIRKQIDMALAQGATVEQIKRSLGNNPAGLQYLSQKAPAAAPQAPMPSVDDLAQQVKEMMPSIPDAPVTQAPAKAVAPPPASIAAASQNPTPAGPFPSVESLSQEITSQMPPMPKQAPAGIAAAAAAKEPHVSGGVYPEHGSEIYRHADLLPDLRVNGEPPGRVIKKGLQQISDNSSWRDNNPLPPGSTQPTNQQPRNPPKPPGAGVGPLKGLGNDQNPAIGAYDDVLKNSLALPQKPPTAPMPKVDPASGGIASGLNLDPMTQEGRNILGKRMRGNAADREGEVREQFTTDNADYKSNIGEQRGLRGERRAEQDAQNDPRKRRREQFSAFAAGAGGRNSSAMAGGIAGAYNARNSQENKRLKGIAALEGMLGKETAANKDYGKRKGDAGTAAYDKSAGRIDNAAVAVVDSGLKARANELNAEIKLAIQNDAGQARLGTLKNNINIELRRIVEAQQEALSKSNEYMTAKNELAKALNGSNKERVALARRSVQEIEQKALGEHRDTIASLTASRDYIDQQLGVAPPATAAGGAPMNYEPGSLKVK
jgi:hypothetical protein